ncbi:MAG: hypothetical protein AB7D05_03905 [Mangrovibacterium sp.]
MKLLFLPVFFLSVYGLTAQDAESELVAFRGYIFSEDSLPVENAHLINYRTLKIIVTDSAGYFNTYLQDGDSLMVNHLSLEPKILHAKPGRAGENRIYVAYRTHLINLVSVNEARYKMEMNYAKKNIDLLYQSLTKLGLRNADRIAAYDQSMPFRIMPGARMSGVSVNALDLVRLIRESRTPPEELARERLERQERKEAKKAARKLKKETKTD